MAQNGRALTVNITATATWTQLLEGSGGAAYAVPAGARGDCALIKALNLGGNSVVLDLAFSPTSTIADDERICTPQTIAAGAEYVAPERHLLRATEGVWARATGVSPNVTVRVSVLEIT